MSEKQTILLDTECGPNYWLINLWNITTDKRVSILLTPDLSDDEWKVRTDRLRSIMQNPTYRFITFNGMSYDMPMIFYVLSGKRNRDIKRANDLIIKSQIKYWEAEKALNIRIPALDHIDLIEPNPSVRQSQKTLAGRLHARKMQDLPYDPDMELTAEQIEHVTEYCWNDIEVLRLLFEALKEPLALREALGKEYNQDFRSKSDAQMGEAIIKWGIEKATGRKPERTSGQRGTSFTYPVPDWMSFQTPELQAILEAVRETEFYIKPDGKVEMPKSLEGRKITIGGSTYAMGIGGLHSTEANRMVASDDDNVLIDADVTSQYPNIIMKLGLYPQALGPAFLKVYGKVLADRVAAKSRAKQIEGEIAELKKKLQSMEAENGL